MILLILLVFVLVFLLGLKKPGWRLPFVEEVVLVCSVTCLIVFGLSRNILPGGGYLLRRESVIMPPGSWETPALVIVLLFPALWGVILIGRKCGQRA